MYSTKQSTGSTPKTGKSNLIESILMGGKETNVFNARNSAENTKPKNMIIKLDSLILNTSDEQLKMKALRIKELLLLLRHDIPASEQDRRRIFEAVNKEVVKEKEFELS